MRRVIPFGIVVAVAWVMFVGTAAADTRPRVAVLGLEVSSPIDVRTTELAKDLTEGMRARARLGSGPYAYAPSSERELIDEKLIKMCDSEAPQCMSDIGRELDADVLVYGKLEKEDKGVRLTLHLLDVGKKQKLNRISTRVDVDATKDAVKMAARKAYEELAGAASGTGAGTVEIVANVSNGTVYVDDSSSEPLVDGKATLTLPEGRYRIAIESPGRNRKEITVTVKPEQVITQQFELGDGTVRGKQPFNVWKPIFGVSAAAFVGVGLYTGYLWIKWNGDAEAIQASRDTPGPITQDDCDGGGIKSGVTDINGKLADVCRTLDSQKTWAIVTVALIPVVAATGYMAFIRKPKREAATSVSFTPVVTPQTAGAVVELRW